MNKRILTLGLSGILVFSNVAFANTMEAIKTQPTEIVSQTDSDTIFKDITIEDRLIEVKTKDEVKVTIPELKGLTDKDFQDKFNKDLLEKTQAYIDEFNKNAKEADGQSQLIINYEVKSKGDTISLKLIKYEIYSKSANGSNTVEFYNVDVVNNKVLSLKDIFKENTNYKDIVNKTIKSQILKDSEKYFEGEDGFTSIKDDQDFYIADNGDLVIVFQQYEIAPRSTGIPEFTISLESIKNILVKEAINTLKVSDNEIFTDTKQDISVIVPKFSGLSNKAYESQLNSIIEAKARKDIEIFEKEVAKANSTGKSELKINYDIKSVGKVNSVVISSYQMISGDANGTTRKDYYNIDTKLNKTLELKDLFKENTDYKNIINKEILRQIDNNKDNYFKGEDGFKSISDSQEFYIDNTGNIIIEFPIYKIAPRSTGTPSFKIGSHLLNDILKDKIADKAVQNLKVVKINDKNLKLDNEMYFSEKGNLMIPLSQVAKELGYNVEWNKKTKIVTLAKDNFSATISLKENRYTKNKALFLLEEEAKSISGTTYVPANFFKEVLQLNSVVDENGILSINIK